jgi:glycine/D-amino acid oxidase-like deaminating enzyme
MRVVVVGCGVIGLLTAIECVRAGASVELVDSGGIPAPLATSNDRYRVVRALHRGDEALTTTAARARREWAELERVLGGSFYRRTGVLTVMPQPAVPDNLALLGAVGEAAQAMSGAELSARYPQLRSTADRAAIFEPQAGAVLAGEALLALVAWLRQRPAVSLSAARRVMYVSESGTVRLADGSELAADGIVIAAGPWSRDLLPATAAGDLTLHRQTMLTYAPARAWPDMPVVLGLGPDHDAWLMPPVAGTAARLSAASACRPVTAMTDRVTPDRWRDHLLGRFAALLADFDSGQVTGARDGYYLSDPAGLGPRVAAIGDGPVWAYAACGGLSFKIAPLVASALADRVLGLPARTTGLESLIPGLARAPAKLEKELR